MTPKKTNQGRASGGSLALMAVLFAGTLSLAACSGLSVKTEEVERQKLRVEPPDPVKLRRVEWHVITPENYEEVFRKMREAGETPVLFGLSEHGYENLSKNLVGIRGFIVEQSFILQSYRDYYESE